MFHVEGQETLKREESNHLEKLSVQLNVDEDVQVVELPEPDYSTSTLV